VPDAPAPKSPWEAAAGEALSGLHPRLLPYFRAIPAGSVGRGQGVFARAGTPRRWLWPVLWALGRQGVLFAAWQRDVPFTVTNRPGADDDGRPVVHAVRTFHFTTGERHMVDAVTATPAGLVDHLGHRRRWSAGLVAQARDGALTMTSGTMRLRVGRRSVGLPTAVSPRVSLREEFDEAVGRQRVSVTLDAPLVGRIYEYTGHFDYSVEPDHPGGTAP
jgi:hypothetical protein